MPQKIKDRVIAIDYLRGICILMVVVNHASLFTTPFDLLSGASRLWVSAAEFFFLLSGLTFGVVRGPRIKTNFRWVLKKTYRRALILYVAYILSVAGSLALMSVLTHSHLPVDMPGSLPSGASLAHSVLGILNLSYTAGWADFLMFYAVYLLVAPFALRFLNTKAWYFLPIFSAGLYVAGSSQSIFLGSYQAFLTWQVYFVFGMVLARFRQGIISWFYSLPKKAAYLISRGIFSLAATVLVLSVLIELHIYPIVEKLVAKGWFPGFIAGAYGRLLLHKPQFDQLLMDNRFGIMRPLVAVLLLAGAYLVYQKYKYSLLRFSGKFINSMGSDTLVIFVAQAFVIPLMAAFPLKRDLVTNLIMTIVLIGIMWLVNKRALLWQQAKSWLFSSVANLESANDALVIKNETEEAD